MRFLNKNLYILINNKKYRLNLYTYNNSLFNKKYNIFYKKKSMYNIYILTYVSTKLCLKEFLGILIRRNKIRNLTKLNLIFLKKYNNIYLSFFKESPNIIIKYKS